MSGTTQIKENLLNDSTLSGFFENLGNDPEKWCRCLHQCLQMSDKCQKKKILRQCFNQAKLHLDPDLLKKDENYAKILAEEAWFIGCSSIENARDAFRAASYVCKRVPLIHLAFSQFELNNGRLDKAQKVLDIARLVLPEDMTIKNALKELNSLENNKKEFNHENDDVIKRPVDLVDHQQLAKETCKAKNGAKTGEVILKRKDLNSTTTSIPSSPFMPTLKRSLEALDLQPSPKPPNLGPITPAKYSSVIKKFNKENRFLDLKTPTPPRLSYSMTKSLYHKSEGGRLKQNCNTSLSFKMGERSKDIVKAVERPRRVLCSLPRKPENNEDLDFVPLNYDDENNVKPETVASGLKPQSTNGTLWPYQQPSDNLKVTKENDNSRQETLHEKDYTKEVADWMRGVETIRICGKVYIVLKVLGEGGSSKVYETFDIATKTTKAVKHVMLKGCDASIRQGFLDEVKFLEMLRHNPNIVHLYNYEMTGDDLYIVMECGSTDLAKLIQRQKHKLKPYEVRYFWRKMLEAVQTIHKHNVIHLDIKPANFLLVKGNLKLIDFGIANSIQTDATSVIKDTQLGTLNYLAPESIMDVSSNCDGNTPKFKISPLADVWSLGCILYLMMFNKTPFQHIKQQWAKLAAITNQAVKIEYSDYPDKQLLQIVQGCLNRDPKKRPPIGKLLQYA